MFDELKLRAKPVEWRPAKADHPYRGGLLILLMGALGFAFVAAF